MSVSLSERSVCPVCEEGYLTDHCEKIKITLDEHQFEVHSEYSTCSHCGSEITQAKQAFNNAKHALGYYAIVKRCKQTLFRWTMKYISEWPKDIDKKSNLSLIGNDDGTVSVVSVDASNDVSISYEQWLNGFKNKEDNFK